MLTHLPHTAFPVYLSHHRICGDEDSDDEIDLTGEFENLTSQSISRQPSIISGESGDLEFGSGSGSARDLEFKKQMAQAKKSSRYEDVERLANQASPPPSTPRALTTTMTTASPASPTTSTPMAHA